MKGHKEAQCRKKSRDSKKQKGARPNTAGAQVAIVNESGLGYCEAKNKNLAGWQSLVMFLVEQEVQALVDIECDLNLIRKDIADNLRLRPLFPARAATQASGIPLKTYSVFHERLQITNSFGAYLDAQDPLTSANIEVPLILGLPWLLHHNPILNFNPITIYWRDSSSTVTDSIEKLLEPWVSYFNLSWFPSDPSAAWNVGWVLGRTNYSQGIQRPGGCFLTVQCKFSTTTSGWRSRNRAGTWENTSVWSALQLIWIPTQDAPWVHRKKPRKQVYLSF